MKTKEEFIEALAEYLVGNETEMSVRLQMGEPDAKAWQKLRDASPLFGYYSDKSKAVRELTNFLK
jgi:hypothetical protein